MNQVIFPNCCSLTGSSANKYVKLLVICISSDRVKKLLIHAYSGISSEEAKYWTTCQCPIISWMLKFRSAFTLGHRSLRWRRLPPSLAEYSPENSTNSKNRTDICNLNNMLCRQTDYKHVVSQERFTVLWLYRSKRAGSVWRLARWRHKWYSAACIWKMYAE